MTGTDTLPSDEAVEAAIRHRMTKDGCCPYCTPHGTIEEGPPGATWTVECEHGGIRQQAMRYLAAAYAIDVPRIRAEERAATLREVRERMDLTALLTDKGQSWERIYKQLRHELNGDFNPEGQ